MKKSPSVVVSASPLAASPHLLGAALAGLLCLSGCSDGAGGGGDGGGQGGSGEAGQTSGGGGNASSAGESSGGVAGDASAAGNGTDTGGMPDGNGGANAAGSPTGGSGETPSAGAPSDAGAAGAAGAGGAPAELPHITSSQNVGVMTEEQFKALCDERGGTVEVMPHCGGFATAKGFSYDSTTELLSEHTCHGANTCSGWNCAIVD